MSLSIVKLILWTKKEASDVKLTSFKLWMLEESLPPPWWLAIMLLRPPVGAYRCNEQRGWHYNFRKDDFHFHLQDHIKLKQIHLKLLDDWNPVNSRIRGLRVRGKMNVTVLRIKCHFSPTFKEEKLSHFLGKFASKPISDKFEFNFEPQAKKEWIRFIKLFHNSNF